MVERVWLWWRQRRRECECCCEPVWTRAVLRLCFHTSVCVIVSPLRNTEAVGRHFRQRRPQGAGRFKTLPITSRGQPHCCRQRRQIKTKTTQGPNQHGCGSKMRKGTFHHEDCNTVMAHVISQMQRAANPRPSFKRRHAVQTQGLEVAAEKQLNHRHHKTNNNSHRRPRRQMWLVISQTNLAAWPEFVSRQSFAGVASIAAPACRGRLLRRSRDFLWTAPEARAQGVGSHAAALAAGHGHLGDENARKKQWRSGVEWVWACLADGLKQPSNGETNEKNEKTIPGTTHLQTGCQLPEAHATTSGRNFQHRGGLRFGLRS